MQGNLVWLESDHDGRLGASLECAHWGALIAAAGDVVAQHLGQGSSILALGCLGARD